MMNTYEKNGKVITFHIKKKPIKNTYFRIKDGYLQVTTHPKTSHKIILSYIDLKFDALYEKIDALKMIEPDQEIKLWAEMFSLNVTFGNFSYRIEDKQVFVKSTWDDIKKIKQRIYFMELEKKIALIKPEFEAIIARKGLRLIPIKLKYLKSKFGSYHRKNKEITLNTFLARLNPIYLSYVIYHEYAHAIVFNHSKDFYNLLGEFMPNHRVYQKDLKKIAII